MGKLRMGIDNIIAELENGPYENKERMKELLMYYDDKKDCFCNFCSNLHDFFDYNSNKTKEKLREILLLLDSVINIYKRTPVLDEIHTSVKKFVGDLEAIRCKYHAGGNRPNPYAAFKQFLRILSSPELINLFSTFPDSKVLHEIAKVTGLIARYTLSEDAVNKAVETFLEYKRYFKLNKKNIDKKEGKTLEEIAWAIGEIAHFIHSEKLVIDVSERFRKIFPQYSIDELYKKALLVKTIAQCEEAVGLRGEAEIYDVWDYHSHWVKRVIDAYGFIFKIIMETPDVYDIPGIVQHKDEIPKEYSDAFKEIIGVFRAWALDDGDMERYRKLLL